MRRIACASALVLTAAAAALAAARPYWSYHNASTLAAQPPAYRSGYLVGVVDGYFAAQSRDASGAEAARLDTCISKGWTTAKLEAAVAEHIVPGAQAGRKAVARQILEILAQRCAGR